MLIMRKVGGQKFGQMHHIVLIKTLIETSMKGIIGGQKTKKTETLTTRITGGRRLDQILHIILTRALIRTTMKGIAGDQEVKKT